MPAYSDPNRSTDPRERWNSEIAAVMGKTTKPPPAPDPALPDGWFPMRTAPRAKVVILYTPIRYFTKMPEVSLGYWDGGSWQMITQVDGDVRKEAVDPVAWQPVPTFEEA